MPFRNGENTGPVQDISNIYPTGNPGKGTYVHKPIISPLSPKITNPKMPMKPKQAYCST
jgi:hypothetical protein